MHIEFWDEVDGVPRSDADQAPKDYVVSGTFPDADTVLAANAPVSAHYALIFARRLLEAIKANATIRSGRGAAAAAGLGPPTVNRVLRGEVLPDLGTVARLEVALGQDLWPAGLHTSFESVNRVE